MAKKNYYQLVQVQTQSEAYGRIRYNFLTDLIYGYAEARAQLADLRNRLADRGCQPTFIWADLFFCGTDVYRLLKANPKLEVRRGLWGW